MTTKVEQYTYEYLANVQASSGAMCYAWKKLDPSNYELTWVMGKYSTEMKASFEKYAVDLLKKYPGVFILVVNDKLYTSDHALSIPPTPSPVPIPAPEPVPKPPIYSTCPICNGTGKVQSKCPTCAKMTLDATCPKCKGAGKVQVG